MDEQCSNCHVLVKSTDYFCFNCGKNLKPVPPSLSLMSILGLYLKGILIPPFGLLWAIPYLRQNEKKSKIVGIVAIVLTLISLYLTTMLLKNLMSEVNNQLNQQLNF